MSPKQMHPGSDIESRCTKCKTTTNHIVVAMIGTTVAKVKCNTCGSEHNFRPVEKERNQSPAVKRVRAVPDSKKAKGSPDRVTTTVKGPDPFEDSADRDYTPTAKVKLTKSRARKPEKSVDPAEEFNRLLEGKDTSETRPYSPNESFSAGDLVSHPSFGLGVVVGPRDVTKVDIAFASGRKTLIHRRS